MLEQELLDKEQLVARITSSLDASQQQKVRSAVMQSSTDRTLITRLHSNYFELILIEAKSFFQDQLDERRAELQSQLRKQEATIKTMSEEIMKVAYDSVCFKH